MSKELNAAQEAAVTYTDGPQLVIAGAGSGKTRVLTYKIAYLLNHGYKPWNILALTFTNKAAKEMKQRVAQLVTEDAARYIPMGTFHSIFSRILRAEASVIGYTRQFTIYDDSDQRSLLNAIVKEFELDNKVYKVSVISKYISRAKNNIELPDDYERNDSYRIRDERNDIPRMADIYREYERRMQLSGAMDFDDLLLKTYLLFVKHDDIRQRYGERFQYILVDEYQDTNTVQQRIVSLISQNHNKVCAVGDDAQSIYAFRGANINNILSFEETFSKARNADGTERDTPVRLFKLEQNYRSTQNIVKAANSIIGHNTYQIQKEVYSENEQGAPLMLYSCKTEKEEAATVCLDIMRHARQDGVAYSDVAILYRTNAQSRTFEEAMSRNGLPYKIVGGLSFYQRKEIKDIVSYFRLAVNNYDEEALRRIINYPARGLGAATLQKIFSRASVLNVAPWDIVSSPETHGLDVNKGTIARLQGFASMISSFSADIPVYDANIIADRIISESGISADVFKGNDVEDKARQENVNELRNSISSFVDSHHEDAADTNASLLDFLQEVSLLTDLESETEDTDNRVTLMTIHAAKGLEFPCVYLVGLEDQIIPSPQSASTPAAIEEERRLMYVAITRACKRCVLSFAEMRYRYGKQEFETPSRFLHDIDQRYIRGLENIRPGHSLDLNEFPFGRSGNEDGPEWMSRGRQMSFRSPSRQNDEHRDAAYSAAQNAARRQTSSPMQNNVRHQTSFPMQNNVRHQTSFPSAHSGQRSVITSTGRRLSPIPPPSRSMPGERYRVADAPASGNLSVGTRIEHSRFGRGTVLKIEGTGENTKATVEFDSNGKKQLLLKFAKFTVLA